jgi:ferrous iron transport protein B
MLAARTIPGKKERWLTLLIIPLMSCSARLPVFALLLAFLFQGEPAWKPGLAMAMLYFSGLLASAVAATVGNKMIRTPRPSLFLLELPAYRRPHVRTVLKTVTSRTEGYLRKAGPVIFAFALILWAASTFPNFQAPTRQERLRGSFAAMTGRIIEPIMEPMGGDWRTGTALISAFAAREVFVSALVIVLNVGEESESSIRSSLLGAMRTATHPDGTPLFTTSSVIGLAIFFIIALQCMSTVGVGRREFGSWKGPITQLITFNLVAYVLAVAAVQALRASGIA